MATAPTSVAIRTYQVGFGDCFLLSFSYGPRAQRHVLVDFGSTGLPGNAPATRLADIARDIAQRCGGKLHAVVATHRHKDHIAGFATGGNAPGDVIRGLEPEVVVQPWTEDPDLAPSAKGPRAAAGGGGHALHVAALAAMHEVAAYALGELGRLAAHVSKPVASQLSILGEDNLANASAVRNLMTMGKAAAYVHHGSRSGLEAVLPGVKVHVLGPPTLEQSAEIAGQRKRDPAEFWQFQAKGMALANRRAARPAPLFARHVVARGRNFPPDTRWLIAHARALRGEQLLQIVRVLDQAMNNTSVILVLEVGRTKLLFPGDAQIENWQFALSKPEQRALLADVDLYKVGHHGSLNATPKSLWNAFKNRSTDRHAPRRLKTLMSTMADKHGHGAGGTEVPRSTLVAALRKESALLSTQDLGAQELFRDTTVAFPAR